jgi:hypothetical protein
MSKVQGAAASGLPALVREQGAMELWNSWEFALVQKCVVDVPSWKIDRVETPKQTQCGIPSMWDGRARLA